MKKKITLCLLVATTLVANEVELEKLSVYSSSIKSDELSYTAPIEIYDDKDIAQSRATNLYEFLSAKTSVITMPSFGNTFAQKIDLRGFGIGDGYQNIVININGKRLNNIDMTPQLLGNIAPSSIKRIEILKSSGVVENGDGANGGVINIITKNDDTKEITLYGGTYNTFGGSLFLGLASDEYDLNIAANSSKYGGSRTIREDGLKDKNKDNSFNIDGSYKINNDLKLRANASRVFDDLYYGGSMLQNQYKDNPSQQGDSKYGGKSEANRQRYAISSFGIGATYNITNALSFKADTTKDIKDSTYKSKSYSAKSTYDYKALKARLEYNQNALNIVLGTEIFDALRDSKAASFSAKNKTTKQNYALFTKLNYSIDSHSFSAGIRGERVKYRYSDATKELQRDDSLSGYELGYNYALNENSSLFASFANSYQAPDIDRFFNKDWFGVVSFNNFIKPADVNSYNIGYSNITKQNRFKTALFYTKLKNEIYYYDDPSFISSKNTNIDKSHKWGVDLYDKFLLMSGLSLMANYNYVIAKIDKEVENGENFSHNDIPGVSKHNIKLSLSYDLSNSINATLTQIYRSKTYAASDIANSFKQKQAPYRSTNLNISYNRANYELFLRMDNILNQKNAIWVMDDALYPINYTTSAIFGLKIKI